MTASFDLHLHSYWSYDSGSTIEYYFRCARHLSVKTIAITEHHTMDSIDEVVEIGKSYPDIEYIPAAELTVHCSIGAVDLVCLGLPVKAPASLEKMFAEYRQWQRDTGDAISNAMIEAGYKYGAEERLKVLSAYRPARVIHKQGITHVKGYRQRCEFIDNNWATDETYADFQQKVFGSASFPNYPAAERVVPEVKKNGGLIFIAHPKGYFLENDLQRMEALKEELSLDGIECAHPSTPDELCKFYREFCLKHNMLSSGGSDCHEEPVPISAVNPAEGSKFAQHSGEDRWLEEIKERLVSG